MATVSVKLDKGWAENPDVWRMRHSSISVKMERGQLKLPMCGACATPTMSVKLNLGGQCRGYRIREVGSGEYHSYHIREDGPVAGRDPLMCGARATPTISVKLDRCGQCRGYRIREDGYRAPESPDVWRKRHSSVSVKLDRGSAMATVSVKMGQADPATRCVAHAPLLPYP